MFVAISHIAEEIETEEQPSFSSMMGFMIPQQRKEKSYNGKPWVIEAISLPFVCLTDGRVKLGVDLRKVTLQKVSREYAKAMDLHKEERKGSIFDRNPPKPETRDSRQCYRCGSRMVERLKHPGRGVWAVICRECGAEQSAVVEVQ
jgi:hypothetical protein